MAVAETLTTGEKMSEPKDIACFDIAHDCSDCKEKCSIWENTELYRKRIEAGFIGEIHRPDGSVQLLKQDTPV